MIIIWGFMCSNFHKLCMNILFFLIVKSSEVTLDLRASTSLRIFSPWNTLKLKHVWGIEQSLQRIYTGQNYLQELRQDKSAAWITFVSMTRHKLPSINFSNFSNSAMLSPCRSSPLVRLSSVDHHMYQHCKLECDLLRQRVIDPEILPQFTGFLCYFLVQHGMHSTIKLKGQKRILPLLIHDHGILWNL